MKYKIKPFDEVYDIWILYGKVWIFWYFVSAGDKEKLIKFVKSNGGSLTCQGKVILS